MFDSAKVWRVFSSQYQYQNRQELLKSRHSTGFQTVLEYEEMLYNFQDKTKLAIRNMCRLVA